MRRKQYTLLLMPVLLLAINAFILTAGGCGKSLDNDGGLSRAGFGTASGTVRMPETLALGRAALFATESETIREGMNVTLERLKTDGSYEPITAVATATTNSEGNFLLTGIPLEEANLIVKAQYDTATASGTLTMRSVLRKLNPVDNFEDGFLVNIDTTFTAEAFRQAVKVTNDNMESPKSAASYDEDLIVKNLYGAIAEKLLGDLNTQNSNVTIDNVLFSDAENDSDFHLSNEFTKLKNEPETNAVDTAYDALKPATSTVSLPVPVVYAREISHTATSPITITLSTDEAGAVIYFTTDTVGIEPTLYSKIYSAPITCSQTTAIKFFALDKDNNREKTNTATYNLISP